MKHRCPICRRIVELSPRKKTEAQFSPFCSRRCKLIDLDRWLDSEYEISSRLSSQESEDSSDTPLDPADKQ
ncbi:DNA gyrase inhibitor YacG [Planctomycetota bacterium]